MKKNNVTVQFKTRTFSKKQNGNNQNREIIHIDESTNDILVKILKVTNNPKYNWQFKQCEKEQPEWRKRIAELNQQLIDMELIIPTRVIK